MMTPNEINAAREKALHMAIVSLDREAPTEVILARAQKFFEYLSGKAQEEK